MRLRSTRLGAKAWRHDRSAAQTLLFEPMDSVRYFELEFAWRAASGVRGHRYLDVSSPRLLPLALLERHSGLRADLINPDDLDLALTKRLAEVLGVSSRVEFHQATALEAPFGCYDLVTSISVIEHIEGIGDMAALRRMWDVVAPGGRLVLTVPCSRAAFEEYLNINPYGLSTATAEGFFGQRFYDEALLEQRVFSTCGRPAKIGIFGERRPGLFVEDRWRKNLGHWNAEREPYAVATEWARFPSLAALPGLGVVGLEFVKTRA